MQEVDIREDEGQVMAIVERNIREALKERASKVCVGCDVPFSEEGL